MSTEPNPLSYWLPFTTITGGYFPSLYEYRQYRLVPPNNPETCEREGNPCDPVTGNKSQVEQDIVFGRSGNLNFTRFYNSLGDHNTSGSLAPGWRHAYSRRLNQGLSNNKITPDSIQSQNYASPSAACTQGWNDIKYQMWGGSLATSGVVEYTGNLLCRVRVANKTVAYLTIYVPLDVVPAIDIPLAALQPLPTDKVVTLTRSNGAIYYFENINGQWIEPFSPKVSLVLDSNGWLFTDADNTQERYDNGGKLLSITDMKGEAQTLSYNTDGLLSRVEISTGEFIQLGYNTSEKISTVTDHTGLTWTYRYGVTGNLEYVDTPDGSTKQYHYEAPNFNSGLTGITDENGDRYATWQYDEQRRAILSEHAGGVERVIFAYNSDGTTTVTDALGGSRTYTFDVVNGARKVVNIAGVSCKTCPNGNLKNRTYDINGNFNVVTDWNSTLTDYDYDLTRNLETKRIEAKGTAQQRTITTQWHSSYRLPTQIAAPLKRTTYSYDANGQLLSKTEQATTDANGSFGLPAKPVGVPHIWSYSYNAKRQIATIVGPCTDVNDITRYVHDPVNGNLISVTNALNHATQITRHDASGRPLRTVDANGLVTQISYTPRGWTDLIKVGTDTVYETTDLDYDGVGQLIKATLADGSYLNYSYDAAHRLTDISDAQGNTIHYTLDLMGNRTATAVTDPNGTLKRTHRNVYNSLNQLSQSLGADKGPDTQTTHYDEYDANGNLKKQRDAQGNITQYGYDAFNRLTTTLDALNGTTAYSYDGQGNLSRVTDPRGNITTYLYDGLGNLTQLISPDTGTTHYTAFDAAGNLRSQTDAKGQTTQYQYDALNRLTQITYADSSTTVYSYDQGSNSTGRLSTITDPSGSLSYQYDLHGRITNKTQTSGAFNLAIAYRYNSAGQLDQITYPSGDAIGYSYTNGKLTAISRNGQPLLSNISVDPFGPVTGWRWGNSTAALYQEVRRVYDLDGQLSSYTLAGTTQQLNYANSGNLTTIADIGNPANNQSYGYDPLNRLTSASGPQGSQSYGYDANGNRLSATANINGNISSDNYTHPASNNRLQSISGANANSYGHDNNGNRINDGLHSYGYDARNRLTTVDASIRYSHNGLGQRTRKTVPAINTSNTNAGDANGDGTINAQDYSTILNQILGTPASHNADCNQDGQVNVQDLVCINIKINPSLQISASTTHFAYDEQGQLIGEYDQNGTPIQETIYLGNLPIAVIKQGSLYRLYADHLNTPRAIADTSNKVVWRWQSDAFGTTAANEDVDGDGTKFNYNLRFPGQYLDQETGLHYNYFRDYDPGTGRYVQSDPIGIDGGLNTYLYANANPLSYVDPEGKSAVIWGAPIVIGGGFTWYKFQKFNACVEACEATNEQCQDGNTRQNLNCRTDCFWQIMGKKKLIKPPVVPNGD